MIGIYKITNKINEQAYIGASVQIHNRWNHHKKRSQVATDKEYNKILYRAFRKYGIENFTFEVLEECEKKIWKKEKFIG